MKEKKSRQLAAVMFTDIVGYSALMQEDENEAAKIRNRHRIAFREQHKVHNGEIVQYFGDGTLSIFKSAIEAVRCAIEIQNRLQQDNPVPLKIGLHMGDIVLSDSEVYGDGVNIASRIEEIGTAGSILLSEKINGELKNHSAISTSSLGYFELKNIAKPVEVFAVSNQGIKVPILSDLKGKQNRRNKTIAVLPFANLSASKDNEYFSDGITEEIINALAKIESLKVTSRTSSFFFKNKNIPITQIGEELGVSTILEGSIRLSGETIRITAQLIQAEEDFHFWSETWDRKLENIFEIQDEISLLIADKLREQFGHFEIQEHLVAKQTDNLDAYEYSLRAKYLRNKWNPGDVKTAISLYEKALELDPDHPESHIGLADCYSFLGTTGFMSFEEAWGKTIQFTNQALKLNDRLSGVYYQLSNQAFFIECDYKKSLQEMKKAIKLNPNNAEAQQFMSFLYIVAGNKEKSRKHLDISISINPLSEETQFFNAYYHYMTGNFTKSLELLDKCLAANHKNIPALSVKYVCLIKLGLYDEVITFLETVPTDVIIHDEKTGAIALAYALKKDKKQAVVYKAKLKEQASDPEGFTADSYLFMLHAISGEHDEAFEWVEQAIKNKSSLLLLRYADPIVDTLINDPRYAQYQKVIFETDAEIENTRKKKALLDDQNVRFYTNQLIDHLTKEKPYLDAGLSLRSLAEQINIRPDQLSWLLNEGIGKNFNEFINHYRIENFKSLAKDPENTKLTIMGLAYDSGFNSKTVFNTYFKKETGLTPSQYMNRM